MFVELHILNGTAITININRIEYFVPTDNGTCICIINNVDNNFGCFNVSEPYEAVKELIAGSINE